MPSGTPVTAVRPGVVVGVSGPTPSPGEDFVFGRRLPRNAILIQHEDSSFALYQNVRAAGIDTGIVVPDRTVIARTGATTTHLKLSVTHQDDNSDSYEESSSAHAA